MNNIYEIVSELAATFKKMAFGLCNDENEIDNAIQELMLYFLQMNPDTLKNIYEKDGKKGILNYGAVALRRMLTSTRSGYYYKYKKYYTHIYDYNTDITHKGHKKSIYNIPEEIEYNYNNEKLDKIDEQLNKLHWYDKKIFELYYYEGHTLSSLAKETKISRNSLFTTIDKVRTILKKELVNE
ncbi:MAG: hypothetical protein Unbinned7837contig1000_39 [Prokaryotic dsDNA virus sp.]|nr:MAG: hypothetical protein Unbinned7837contig1000_39 [Prokaryotic dsDNA virus sp.]